jgi:methyl-accepting chemotaxis protein
MKKEEANHLLEHWIEHNDSHSKSFRERAKQVREISPEAAVAIEEAAEIMDQSTQRLKKAKEVIQGI